MSLTVMAVAQRLGQLPFTARYAIGLGLFSLALAGRFMLRDVLPAKGFPFLTFFPAVLIATYLAGLGPGLMVAALSTLSAWAFFMGAPLALHEMARSDLIALIFFAGILVVDCVVIQLMNSAMGKLRTTSRQLRNSQSELMQREAELREADRQKDVFLAMLAHELRNPLAPIRSAAELITACSAGNDKALRAAAIIDRQSTQLTRLIDDLLDVSRVRSGKLHLRMTPVDLRRVIESAVETCQPVIERAGHHLAIEMPAHAVTVDADSTRIAQCVANLLHNAVKFTPLRAGSIDITLTSDAATATIRIRDNGRGIAPDMLPRLFDLFFQERASGTDGNSGLGIGLALTRHLVTEHRGRITVASDGMDKGAQFCIELPLARTA